MLQIRRNDICHPGGLHHCLDKNSLKSGSGRHGKCRTDQYEQHYFLEVLLKEHQDFFQESHRGTYSVKILNKTIELENTESIYSSVNMVEAYSGFPDNTIYDLQGRKIVNGKRKGIYIRNGKIVVVK